MKLVIATSTVEKHLGQPMVAAAPQD